MGKTQKKLFLVAGIISVIYSILAITAFLLLNFVFKPYFNTLLTYLETELGFTSIWGSTKTYFNDILIVTFLVNAFLGFKYISYSKMSIRRLTAKSAGMFFVVIANAFFGGSLISLILAVIAMSKPIIPSFNDQTIKELDKEVLDNNSNTVAKILKIKQDRLNGLISEEEFKDRINKILDEEARRYLWGTMVVHYLR